MLVRLDNANIPANGGRIIDVSPAGWRERYADRDGAVPHDLRLWRAPAWAQAGDRVSLGHYAGPFPVGRVR